MEKVSEVADTDVVLGSYSKKNLQNYSNNIILFQCLRWFVVVKFNHQIQIMAHM